MESPQSTKHLTVRASVGQGIAGGGEFGVSVRVEAGTEAEGCRDAGGSLSEANCSSPAIV